MSIQTQLKRLAIVCRSFTPEAAREKLLIMQTTNVRAISRTSHLILLYQTLSYIRAFPDSMQHYAMARELLNEFLACVEENQNLRDTLTDSGFAATELFYSYSYHAA